MGFIALTKLKTDTDITNYMPLPRELLDLDIPAGAAVLYAVLLDRGTLSQKNEYADETGWVYVIYTIEALSKVIGMQKRTVSKLLNLLEDKGLILRERTVRNSPNHIYLSLPAMSVNAPPTGTERTPEVQKNAPPRCTKMHPNNIREQHKLNNNYYQHSEEESL